MKKYHKIVLLIIFIPSLCIGLEKEHLPVGSNHSGIVDLSPKLRNLFTQEMRQLQKGMADILPLYISGKWAEIVPIAKAMEDSYVLKNNLSKQQMHELHSKLPNEFIELDQEFHYLSGMLGHAAKMKKPELIGFYFAKLSETCLSCHSKFATHKFPALMQKPQPHDH